MMNNALLISSYPIFVKIKKIRQDQYWLKYSPDELREELITALDPSWTIGSLEHYAIVALIDDALITSQWEFADQWLAQSLQSMYYTEQIAGQGLLDRLHAALQDPALSSERVEFLTYCYLWRTESRESDPLFLQLKDKLIPEPPLELPPIEKMTALPPLRTWVMASLGILVIIFVWLHTLMTWELHRATQTLTREESSHES